MQKTMITALLLAAVTFMPLDLHEAKAEVSLRVGTPNLNFSLNDYQPAPPNVHIHNDRGRPYYLEKERRVYMKKKPAKQKKMKKEHDRGHGNGHDKHDRRD